MWMQRLGQTRSHWKQMMHWSFPVCGSTGRASSPCQRGAMSTFLIGYITVVLGRSITVKVRRSPVSRACVPSQTRLISVAIVSPYRSTSESTISTLPRMAMTSATFHPFIISDSAYRLLKAGARIFTR